LSNVEYAREWKKGVPSSWKSIGMPRHLVRHVALSAMATFDRTAEPRFLRCLYCHYVFDDQRQRFETLLLRLMKLGSFVDTDTCLAMLHGTREIDGRHFHLSFDDGFRNVLQNALPILRQYGIPSLVFVPTALMNASPEAVREYCLKTTKYARVIELSTWEDLRSALADKCEVGSHTRTHARLADLSRSPERLRSEIEGSKRDIEEHLGVECKYVAWPFGRITDINEDVLAAVRLAGYRGCFGAFRGSIVPAATDAFCIPRHHVEVQWPLAHTEYFARGKMERWWENPPREAH